MTSAATDPKTWPDHPLGLVAFLPLVHSAWSDGILSPDEMRALHAYLDAQAWLSKNTRHALAVWLDPDAPPSPDEMAELRARIRNGRFDGANEPPRSLADLGIALAGGTGREPWSDPDRVEGLRALERALGIAGPDAVRGLLGVRPADASKRAPARTFDAESLHKYLDVDHRRLRDEILEIIKKEPFRAVYGLPLSDHRDRALKGLQVLAEGGYTAVGFPEAYGGTGDPGAGVTVFETLALGDLSTVVKFGVQVGLFGGSVLQLGTGKHHRAYLRAIATLELPGCYAMTETAHGSNVWDLETTATYDHDRGEIVVHTPHDGAAKDWIGNAGMHGRMASVFARLIVGGEDRGVHVVLVPIRSSDGSVLPGIRIEDRGLKVGLNGVDNGRIWFDAVRVPRTNLLDRFATIGEDGAYRSDIPSAGRRFFTTLGTLVLGRVSVAAASVSATKAGLTIAVRYTTRRRQFGPEGGEEVPLLDHRLLQRALMPRLATTYGLHFAVRELVRRLSRSPEGNDPELEVRAAGLKAYASRHAVDTLQAAREACGGQGYLAANRFAALKADTDIFTTFEGANEVLWQLVAKGLLSRFRHAMGDLRLWGMIRYLADRAGAAVTELNPVATRRTDEEHLRDPSFHRAAFTYREERLLRSVAKRLKARIDDGLDAFRATNECQDHLVQLATAHVERLVLEAFQDGVARAPAPGLSEVLGSLCSLYALSTIEAHRGWYLESGYLEAPKSRAVRAQVNALAAETRENAALLVDSFGIPDEVLTAPAGLAVPG